jgi:pyruvate dehydrogenase E2 component (dihydrolipoamide acetyltransferase)
MATKVFMEALSPTMEEGRLVRWARNEGDQVKSGDVLAEVETDKAVMELVARGDGVLRKRLVPEGETRPVGSVVGIIATADENIDALLADAGGPAPAAGAPAPEQVIATAQETAGASSIPRTRDEAQGEASTPPQQKVEGIPAQSPGPGGASAPPAPAPSGGKGGAAGGLRVTMEALSPTMEEGRLVRWVKKEGDAVKSGEPIAEVETDKAVMELVARGDGILRKQVLAEGTAAPVGSLVGVIASADADISAILGGAPATGGAAAAAPQQPAAPGGAQQTGAKQPAGAAQGTASGNGGRVRSSPLARRLASSQGLDIGRVQGSGPGGRIVRRDIEAAMAAGGAEAQPRAAQSSTATAQAAATSAPPRAESREPSADFNDVPLTQIRKTIARRLSESIGPIPTFYLTAEIDLGKVAELRQAMVAMGDAYKVSVNDVVLKAVATALAQHPEVNAHWLGDRIRYHNRVHLGMAVATSEGLIVPVIFDADRKRMSEISREAKELAKLARGRKLKPEQYTGSTFSVSNLGMFGIDQFTAIINPPEVGILAIGSAEDKPVVVNGELEIRKRLRVTMSCDHRVIDGAVGAQFLQTLRRMIENPLMLVY